MIDPETITTITHASLEERIRIIEIILESLKSEVMTREKDRPSSKRFKIKTFDLGADVICDRDSLYEER